MARVRAVLRMPSRITPVETVARLITSGKTGLRAERIAAWCGKVEPGEGADIGGDVGVRDAEGQHRLVVLHQAGAGDMCVGGDATSTSSGRPE